MIRKVLVVFGTRPEAIKMVPVIRALNLSPTITPVLCLTGQHKEMLQQVLEIFSLQADFNLEVMLEGQTLSQLQSRLFTELDAVVGKTSPDIVMVHGDTASAFCASVVAYNHRIAVAHVEAGLRTGDLYSPWPEEGNRKLIGALASLHFAPTRRAADSLKEEGISEDRIYITGNTVIDALMMAKKEVGKRDMVKAFQLRFPSIDLARKVILVTGHRRENFGKGFEDICEGLSRLSRAYPDIEIIYPVHLNPKVKDIVSDQLGGIKNIHLIPPLNYLEFVFLMDSSFFILTDSGGIQEEAPSLGKPVLVMRDTTERPEAVAAGTVKLVGTCPDSIFKFSKRLIEDDDFYRKMSDSSNPFGDGLASGKIIKILEAFS